MKYLTKILNSFEFDNWLSLVSSMYPSLKYNMTGIAIAFSSISVITYKIFGIDTIAFIAFICVMISEVVTGIIASKVAKIETSSIKLSRFSLKMSCYLVMMFVSNSFAESFQVKGSNAGYWFFDWLHLFLTVHIAVENIVSIGENLGVITGKGKTYWIGQIQSKVNDLFKVK